MADRRASVSLELRASQFKAEATMAEAKVEGLDRSVEKLDRSITKIPPDAAKAAAAMKLLGDESGKAGLKLENLGKSSTSMGLLDERIVHTRGELRKLADEFNRTGDAGTLQRLFKTGDELKDLERFRKRLVTWASGTGTIAAQEFTKNFSGAAQGALSTPALGPALIAALVAAAVAAGPAVAAALNGALLAGVGLGGVALGIVGQVHDPAVKAAFVGLANDFMTELSADTASFRAPLIGAAATFGDALRDALRGIDFSKLADAVGPLARGLAGLVTNLNLGRLFADAVPLVQELAEYLPAVGQALGDMFHEMAGSEGAAQGLRMLLATVIGAIELFGILIRTLSDTYAWLNRLGDNVSSFVADLTRGIPLLGDFAEAVHDVNHWLRFGSDATTLLGRSLLEAGDSARMSVDDLKSASDAWKDVNADLGLVTQTATSLPATMDAVSHAMHGTAIGMVSDLDLVSLTMSQVTGQLEQQVFGAIMGVAQANIAWHQSLLDVNEAAKQNGTTLADNTKEGLSNQLAILGMVQGNQQLYQANIASGMSADGARQQYEQNHDQMVRSAVAAGYNANEVHGLTDAYRGVPRTAETEIIAHGIRQVLDAINDLIWQLALLNGKSATVDVYYRTHGMPAPSSGDSHLNFMAHGGIRHAAHGLIVGPSDPGTLIGEPQTGGEALIPLRGISRSSAMGLSQAVGNAYGFDVVQRGPDYSSMRPASMGGYGSVSNIYLTVNAGLGTNGAEVGRQIADRLRPFISSHGGNVQAALGKRGA